MIPLAGAAPASAGLTVQDVTEIFLALAAVVGCLTPIVLRWHQKREKALAAASASGAHSTDLTLAGWEALNSALQTEIRRLQGLVDKMQARISELENQIAELQKLALALPEGRPDA